MKKLCVVLCVAISFTWRGDTDNINLSCKHCFSCRLEGPISADDPRLIRLVRERFLFPPSNGPYNLTINEENKEAKKYNLYRTSPGFVSWQDLNAIINTLYKDEGPGFFVEAGSLDGEFISNTLDLERLQGWTGLLVEVDQDLFSRLKRKNRKAWMSNICLASASYPYETTLVSFMNYKTPEKGFPIATRGFNAMIEAHDLQQRMAYGIPAYYPATCIPLQTLFLAANVSQVDLFSLDVEGMERGILSSFFGSKSNVTVDTWIIEHSHSNVKLLHPDTPDFEFIDWVQSMGYTLYTFSPHTPADYIFIRNGSTIYERAFASRPARYNIDLRNISTI